MTTIGITQDSRPTPATLVASKSVVLKILLLSGVISSLLYVLTDLLGGMRYDGYSFTSQAISELGAIGAPSKQFVDPLFFVYNLLALAFGIGVYRAAAGANRGLRITGAALIAYGAIGIAAGFVGSFFSMHQRGTGSVASDSPHIILTAILVLLLLVAMGFGAFALGRRFRVYSLSTIAIVIAFGALTAQYAPQVAADRPTPGMGIFERIDVYSVMLWVAVLAVALLRRPSTRDGGLLP
jgi:hypothetical membrane protein